MITISNETAALFDEMRANRRALHQIPEEGLREYRTRQYILDRLAKMGITDIGTYYQTGIRAVVYADKPAGRSGRTIGFRSDMDALGVEECTGLEFASQTKGMMHACGHDGHMAMLLGLAHYCALHKNELNCNVVFLFQPAEESVGGAKHMIDEGALENPKADRIYGFHLMPEVPLGKIGVKSGPMMAQTCEFDIIFTGKTAHGAMPHKGADTVAAACEFYNGLQTILTRRIDPYENALITIGKISGGCRRNIIADKTVMEGTMRTFSEEVYTQIKSQLINKMNYIAQSFGAAGEFNEGTVYPVVNNPEKETGEVIKLIGEENVFPIKPMMIAEDFSYYQKAVPSVFMFLGCAKKECDNPTLHSSSFDFDETALMYGLEIYTRILGSIK